jgi:hypothetical protein
MKRRLNAINRVALVKKVRLGHCARRLARTGRRVGISRLVRSDLPL